MRRLTHGTERCGRALRATALLTLLTALLVAPGTAGAAAPGGFSQLASPLGCIQVSAGPTCRTAFGLNGPYKLAVSPDGKNVYQAAYGGSFTIYDRDVNTGALTQKPGAAGCIQNGAGTPGTCAGATALANSNDVAVSPDGKTVWVVASGSDAVAVFTRNTSNGTLTQKAGLDGCVANANAACRDAEAMDFPYDLTISPDGKSVYVASFTSASVTALVAASDGVLSQPAAQDGFFGCVTEAAVGTCQDGRALSSAIAVAATSDSKNVYASTQSSSVVALERNSTGRIRMETSPNACATQDRRGPLRDASRSSGPIARSRRAPTPSGCSSPTWAGTPSFPSTARLTAASSATPGPAAASRTASSAGCTTGRGLAAVQGLAPSTDGLHLYANSNGAVVELKVSGSGGLSPRADKRGCVQLAAATSDCQQGVAISNGFGIALSPNGRSIYAAEQNSNAITVYKRDSATPVCQSAGGDDHGRGERAPDAAVLGCRRRRVDVERSRIHRRWGAWARSIRAPGQVTFASSGVPGDGELPVPLELERDQLQHRDVHDHDQCRRRWRWPERWRRRRWRHPAPHDPAVDHQHQLAGVQEVHEAREPLGQEPGGRLDGRRSRARRRRRSSRRRAARTRRSASRRQARAPSSTCASRSPRSACRSARRSRSRSPRPASSASRSSTRSARPRSRSRACAASRPAARPAAAPERR